MLTSLRATVRTLPRDSRDTLFLLAVVGCVIAPQLLQLPIWASGLAVALLLWRGQLAWKSEPLPSRWWRAALTVIAVAATAVTYRTIAGREAGVTLVVMLLALKTLELRARRDAMVIFFLGFFVMLTNFLFSQSLLTAAAMVLALAGLLTGLVQAHMPVGRPPLAEAARTALKLMLYGAPVMAALFLFFPRLAPLWGTAGDEARGKTGLSNDMRVGNIARLALDDGVAMRIRFLDRPAGESPSQRELYFRGPVLSAFDGRNWQPLSARLGAEGDYVPRAQASPELQIGGPPVRYEATLEPSGHPWLLLMDATPGKPEGTTDGWLTSDLQWVTARPLRQLVRYRAESYPQFSYGATQRPVALRAYTETPPGFDPRTHALAQQMTRRWQSDSAAFARGTPALVDAALLRLRGSGYTYTLDPGEYGMHTADEFWFDKKEGFCEHIASAFVVLMRAMDVPSRIVTGYQGGEVNSIDGIWTVRQSDAHAWAEVWHAGQGWVRVDPTAAVAPNRISQLQRLQPRQSPLSQAFGDVIGRGISERARAAWEAVNNRWNQWILNYTQGQQLDLLKRMGFNEPDWRDLVQVLVALIVLASIAGAGWAAWTRQQRDPWLRLLDSAYARLRRAGLALSNATPPRSAAGRALLHFGAEAEPLAAWLLRMEAQRYAASASGLTGPAALRRLRAEARHLRWPRTLLRPAVRRPGRAAA